MREDVFARHVKDALVNFYDPVHLQNHPLSQWLVLDRLPGQTTGEALRQLLRETIDALRPPASIPLDRPEWLNYRILWLRYIQSFSQADTCRELGLSQTTYYRRHQEALDAVTTALWERSARKERVDERASAREERSIVAGRHAVHDQARQQAARLARAAAHEPVRPEELLEGIRATILPLAQQQGVTLDINVACPLPTIYADPAILRQIILNVLTQAMKHAAAHSLQLSVCVEGERLVWYLRGLVLSPDLLWEAESPIGLAISRELLELYGGELRVDAATACLMWSLPLCAAKTVLIIEDDADTINLYQRFLHLEGLLVRVAQHGDDLEARLAADRPDVILLDVLMPKRDGWAILQRLKALPEAQHIPVIVCSVLNEPNLALALGAEAVLSKPISEHQLLEAIRAALGRSGSVG